MESVSPVTDRPPPSEFIAFDPERHPPREITPMTQASIAGDLGKVQEAFNFYLRAQGSQNPKLYKFDCVLTEAIQWKQSEIISYLLSAGVPLEKVHCYKATEVKSTAVYEVFLQNGWDINRPLDIYEPPALGFIVDDWELTNWFLDRGADPNAGCYLDYTPMSCAVKNAPMKTVKLLFECGGDIKKGQLIHHAVERGSQDVIEMLDLLMQKGAQLNERKYEDHWPSWNMMFFMGLGTPLHGATRARKLQVVDYLLRKGADIKVRDSMDRTTLYYASQEGLSEIIKLLEKREKEVEEKEREDWKGKGGE